MKINKTLLIVLSLLFAGQLSLFAQHNNNLAYTPYWYIGAGIESPFMYGDMYSVTSHKINLGFAPNITLGYRFNSIFGLELKGLIGSMKGVSSEASSKYWLGSDGMTYYPYTLLDGTEYTPDFSPDNENLFFGIWENNKLGISGTRYANAYNKTRFFQLALLGSLNLNRLFMEVPKNREQRLSLLFKPGLYLNKYISAAYSLKDDKKMITPKYNSPLSLGLGGELSLNWAISKHFGIDIYTGAMWVTDQKFDGISTIKIAKDDFIWSIGVKINFKILKKQKKHDFIIVEEPSVLIKKPKESKPYIPNKPISFDNFVLTTFTPNLGVVKQQEVEENARFQFHLSNTDLKPNLSSNQFYINKIDTLHKKLKKDSDINIKSITIEGFASPEGSYNFNVILADKRAKAVADYLVKEYNYSNISYFGKGENWDGLKKALNRWDAIGKDRLIKIVNSNKTKEEKKKALIACGAIYKKALKEIYPPLRIIKCIFKFEIKPYTIEQCIINFNICPEKLSADEMVAVANTYPIYSDNFIATVNKAYMYYPQNEMLACYKAAIFLKRNQPKEALKYLETAGENHTALSLRGVAQIQLGHKDLAIKNFKLAKSKGSLDAEMNMKLLQID